MNGAKQHSLLERLAIRLLTVRNEERRVLGFLRSLSLAPDHSIVDVGCGYGRMLDLLGRNRFNVLGVDTNPAIVSANKKAGYRCMTSEDFAASAGMYDVILMFHIIEHFSPEKLVVFIDDHLDRLKPGGYLIIATPLFSPYFYDDFYHTRPYHPEGINMVFGAYESQAQQYSRNRLQLLRLWYRRNPFRHASYAGLSVSLRFKVAVALDILLAGIYRLTLGIFGRKDGWMGLYRKLPGERAEKAANG